MAVLTKTQATTEEEEIVYPDSDGKPIADNTKQAEMMVFLKTNLDDLFSERDDVFVAIGLLWYPVKGESACAAPDALVAFGRPKGDRGSYKQWEEEDIPPQVVFEILSPGNRAGEMLNKFLFYDRHGVEEYYLYNPETFDFSVVTRQGERLVPVEFASDFISPRLGVRFELPKTGGGLVIYRLDGRRFLTFLELEAERANAEAARDQAESARVKAEARADNAEVRADNAEVRAERLAAQLRALGVDPDA